MNIITRQLKTHATRLMTASLFAAAVAAGLSASSVMAQGYYPPTPGGTNNTAPFSPLDGLDGAALLYIEGFLPATATFVVPPASGNHVASDAEIQIALQAAVSDELAGVGFAGGTLADLVSAVTKYRSSKADKWMTSAGLAILADSTNKAVDLGLATTAASSPDPKKAANVVKAAIKLIATPGSLEAPAASDLTEDAVAVAAIYADKIVTGAMASAKKIDVGAPRLAEMKGITSGAIDAAIANSAGYLLEEIMKSASKATKTAAEFTVTEAINAALIDTNLLAINKENAAAVVLGVYQGVGVTLAATAAADASAAAGFAPASVGDNYLTHAAGAYAAAKGGVSSAAGANIDAYITAGNKDYIAAIVAGGAAAWSGATVDIVKAGLIKRASLALAPESAIETNVDIIVAGLRSAPKSATSVAGSVVGSGSVTVAQIAEGVGRGADIGLIGKAIGKLIKSATATVPHINDSVDKAIVGANATGKSGALAEIAIEATKASKQANVVVDQILLSATPGDQYIGVLGVIAADKKNAVALKAQALASGNLAVGQAPLVTVGSDTLIGIQGNKNAFANISLTKITGAATDAEKLAVIWGASLGNPKGVSAFAALGVVHSGLSDTAITGAVSNVNRKAGASVALSLKAANHVKAGTSDLASFVDHQVLQNPKLAADVVTGAVIAAPQYAHIIAHSAGFRAPASGAKLVPVLFAHSQLDNPLMGNIGSAPAAAAAITSGLVIGIREAKLATPAKEVAALRNAVTAAVKAAVLLESTMADLAQSDGSIGGSTTQKQKGSAGVVTGFIAQSINPGDGPGLPGGAGGTIAAVITAATKAAKDHGLEIAQAAAQAAAWITGGTFVDTGDFLAGAVMAAAPKNVTLANVKNAIAFGVSQAGMNIPGAGAAGVVNYAHSSGTGAPVTSIFDL